MKAFQRAWSLTACLLLVFQKVYAASSSLVITMMCRDEEVNLNANLEKWTAVADYFVFIVDSRTIDGTEQVSFCHLCVLLCLLSLSFTIFSV